MGGNGKGAVRGWEGKGGGMEAKGVKKITCSQECWALLWVSGGKHVAGGMKSVEEAEMNGTSFQDCLCCVRESRNNH